MTKIILLPLIFIISFTSYAQSEPTTQELVEKASIFFAKKNYSKSESEILMKLQMALHKEVIQEIEEEARQKGLDKDKYIESAISFSYFVKTVEMQALDLTSLTNAQKITLLLKTGLRLNIQKSIRFIPEGYFENQKRLLEISMQIMSSLGLNPEELVKRTSEEVNDSGRENIKEVLESENKIKNSKIKTTRE